MDEVNSFTEVLTDLKGLSKRRDPRSVRLASVTSALTDVIEGDITAAKVYASAVTTLEGTLHQQHQELESILDSLTTQNALLEVLRLTLSHVAPATIAATFALTSRVLRSIVISCRSVALDETQGAIFETKDGLGSISFVLCASSQAAAELLRNLPPATDQKTVRQLLNATLLTLVNDTRPKVRSSARNELCGLLNMTSPPCHGAVLNGTSKYVHAQLDDCRSNAFLEKGNRDLIDLLGFLQLSIMSMDFPSIGARLMEMLMNLLADCSSLSSSTPVFLAKSRDATIQILTINAILSTVLAMLEHDATDSKIQDLVSFAARVLATLIQARPTLTFRDGTAEWDLLQSGRTIYGQVILSACQRLLVDKDHETGCKLLPLTIQHVLNLSRPSDASPDSVVADTLLVELSQLFRAQLQPLKTADPKRYERCSKECLGAMQIVLQPSFQQTWSVSLKTLTILLQQMNYQDDAVKTCVQSMMKLRCSLDQDKHSEDAVDHAFSSLIEGIGIESFWDQVELSSLCSSSDEASAIAGISNQLPWVFKVLKVAGSISGFQIRVSFFQENVLPLARHYDALSVKDSTKAAFYKSQVLDLWALFPIFCRHPVDLVSSFPKLVPVLVRAMNDERYPQVLVTICAGLVVLARGICDRLKDFEELVDGEEAADTRLEAQLIGKLSERLLPFLFKLVDTLHDPRQLKTPVNDEAEPENDSAMTLGQFHGGADQADRVRAVAQAIASLAQVASRQLLQSLFSKVIQRLLEASQAEDDLSEKMCSLLTLSQALVTSKNLDQPSISLLYRSLKPLIRTDETKPRIQKRAYKVLAEICNRYHAFVTESKQVKELLELLTSSTATSQISARFMRIKCLNYIVNAFAGSSELDTELISSLVGETLLCLKDSNAKTRDAAYKLLLSMAEVQGDRASFIQLITAAVASKTTHMRSAALMALSRLAFEYASEDPSVQNLLPSLLKTVLLLSDDPSREVVKSLVGFVRVSIVAMTPEQLQPLLPDILNGLLKYHRGKDRFRAKIKIIIKKLVKLFGFEALMPLVPESDSRLLTHMRKLSDREARRKSTRRDRKKSEAVHFDEMVASDEDDSDDGRTLLTSATRMSRMTNRSGKQTPKRRRGEPRENTADSVAFSRKSRSEVTIRLKNDNDGNVFDVMDLAKKTVRFTDSPSEDSDSEGPIEFDVSGKLVVPDSHSERHSTNQYDDNMSYGTTQSRIKVEDSAPAKKIPQKRAQKLGSSYKAKKAGGDVKKKGQKYDPYAYVPLDGRSYTKKNRHHAVEQMGAVVLKGRKRQKRS